LSYPALEISWALSIIEDWAEDAIATRGGKLFGFAKGIWGVPMPKTAQ
jgi:hypothetical protein